MGDGAVDKSDLWNLRDTILEEMRAGFKGVHERQDVTNGRVNAGEVQGAAHGVQIKNLEAEVFHRRKTDHYRHLHPVSKAPSTGDDRSISQRDVRMVAIGAGGLTAIVGFFWKFLPFLVKALTP